MRNTIIKGDWISDFYRFHSSLRDVLFLGNRIYNGHILFEYIHLHFCRVWQNTDLRRPYRLQYKHKLDIYKLLPIPEYILTYSVNRNVNRAYIPFSLVSHSVLVLNGNSRSHPIPQRHSHPAEPVTDFSIRHPLIISLSVQQSLKSSITEQYILLTVSNATYHLKQMFQNNKNAI